MNVVVIAKYIRPEIIYFLRKEFSEAPFFVVSPEVGDSYKDKSGVCYMNDCEILDYDELKERISPVPNFKWYYQQFLKYYAVLYFEGTHSLIIDGDTLVKNTIVDDSSVLWYTPRKVDKPYAKLNAYLFPKIYQGITQHSYITNQMLFSKAILQDMLNEIETSTNTHWVDTIATQIRNGDKVWFSEYLLYADYVLWKYPNEYTSKPLKIFRRMDLVTPRININLWGSYDIVAYEIHHKKDILRRIRAYIYFYLNINIG